MKKFICKITILSFIVILIVSIITGGIYFIQSKASFKLSPDKHILVIGDSHTECAIDDDIYSCAENVSQGATAYLYSYCKLKKFLNENNHIDTVLLSFHYLSLIADGVDNRWIFGENFLIEKVSHHLTLLNNEEIAILTHERTAFVKAILHPPYRILFNFIVKKGSISYQNLHIGEYEKLDMNKLEEDIARNKNKHAERAREISFYQKEYLLKIVDLCKSKNVELILINSPIYKPEIYGDIDKLNDYYNTYLSGIKYLDYSAFALPDSCYRDIYHLNYKGAEIFSKYLQENFGTDAKLK
jgi:hypothetical protein